MSHPSPDPGPPDAGAACILLNAAGVTLRKVGTAASARTLAVGNVSQRVDLTSHEREQVRMLVSTGFVAAEQDRAQRESLSIITVVDPLYPELLLETADPPLALYVRGRAEWLSSPAIGLVGSRNASAYGRSAAQALASQLALKGVVVVSGFARGIDSAAHSGAIASGGATVAVLGCGSDIDYPRGHAPLRDRIAGHGCLVTEFPMGRKPDRTTFPRRNRIISGLSRGVVVVEAQERSGALITARHAAEQNREVFAVPGNVFSHSSRGPHRLLKDGATLVESADDIMAQLQGTLPLVPIASPSATPESGTIEARVFASLGREPVLVDDLSQKLALPMSQLMPVLSLLEIKRCIVQHPGKRFARP